LLGGIAAVYNCTFIRGVVCRLSVVCHIRALCLNPSADLHLVGAESK